MNCSSPVNLEQGKTAENYGNGDDNNN